MTHPVRLVVLAVLLMALMVAVGCPQRGQQAANTSGPPAGAAAGPAAPGAAETTPPQPAAAKGAGPGADLAAKQAAVKSYIMSMVIDGKPMGRQYLKFTNGKLVRMRTSLGLADPSGGYTLLMVDKNVTYVVNPKEKTAIKMSGGKQGAAEATEAGPAGTPKMPDLKDLEAQSPQWGTDTVDGVECWKVETMGVGGAASSAVWIDKQYGLPRQMQMGDKLITQKYEKINAVPDSEFELPPGTKVIEGMPGAPSAPAMPKPPKMPAG